MSRKLRSGAYAEQPRPAWYSAGQGPLRDWTSLLHPPYTAWHLSYVLIGAALAPAFHLGRLLATLAAFALAVGIGAHGLDELKGRPLHTEIPSRTLAAVSALAISGAVALGVIGTSEVGWPLSIFILAGIVLVVGYNLELWGGRMHSSTVFALGWGSFPLLTAYYAQASTVRVSALVAAAFAFWLSRAQRALSMEARDLRRRVVDVQGARWYEGGLQREITRGSLLGPVENALVAMSWAACLIGTGMVVARTGH